MRAIFLATISLLSYLCTAQSGDQDSWTQMPDFAAKSPEAAAFERYGNYNVNLSKGSVGISVPLYTLNAGDYSLPIALSYQPTGIKVNQDATWVGLGWSLTAGAQITLDTRDTPDENVIPAMPSQQYVNDYLANTPSTGYCDNYMNTLKNNSWIKDVYHFSSPTANGKFIIGDAQTGDVKIYPPDAFKVEYSGNVHTRAFKITDTQGNEYYFTNTRETSSQVGISGSQDFTSAWYVDQIKTPSNNIIQFNYTNDGYHAKLNVNDQITKSSSYNPCPSATNGPEVLSATQPRNTISTTKTYKITSIEYKDFRILFEAVAGRLDLATPSLLAQAMYPNQNVVPSYLRFLQVQKKVNSSYVYVKGYEFQYSYFDAGGSAPEYYRKRLKLNAVVDMIDNTVATTFTYSSVNLPAKNSRSIDAWGYYNGASNSTTLVPSQTIYVNGGQQLIGGANRSVVTANVQACMLTDVTYPTKGKTKFLYESNQFFGVDELVQPNNLLIGAAVDGTGNPSGVPNVSPGADYIPTCNAPNPVNCPVYQQIPYNITANSNAMLTCTIGYSGEGILTQNKWQYARLRVYPAGTLDPLYDTGEKKYDWSVTNQSLALSGQGVILIEAYGQYMDIGFNLTYTNVPPSTPHNVNGPGLRIQEIQNFTDATTMASKKRYTYTIPGEGDKTSGKLVFDGPRKFAPEYFRSFSTMSCFTEGSPLATPVQYWVTGYSAIYRGQAPFYVMNEISYTDVKEETIDLTTNSNNGYILYNYDFHTAFANQDASINIEYDWLRGNLLSKKVYRPGDKIVYQEVNSYYEDTSKSSIIAGVKVYFRDTFVTCPSELNPPPEGVLIENMGYSYTIPWYYLKSKQTTETLYNSSDQISGTVVDNTTFNYNNPTHMQMSSTVTTSSLGESVETKYFYPGDTEVASEPCVSDLIAKNMLGPLKVQAYRASVKTGEKKIVFKNWGDGLIAPELSQGAKGAEALETRLQYVKRDTTNGNVLEIVQPGGVSVCYIWGYNGVYPIAKLENMTYSQILSGLGTTVDALRLLTEVLSNIRTVFPYTSITTFTYEPLKGLTSTTSPNGVKTMYTYDGLGRLKTVRDADNYILSENIYNYRP